LRKAALAFMISTLCMAIIVLSSFASRAVKATSSQNYSIELVNHRVQVLYDGHVFMTDTIHLVGNDSDSAAVISDFIIGFPYKYGDQVVRCMAYNSSTSFQVASNVPLEDRMGFYAVEVTFPQPLSVKNGSSHVFTVGFILSNSLLQKQGGIENVTTYILDFPQYPSLTKIVSLCNASIVTPGEALYISGTVKGLTYSAGNLSSFSYSPATVTFATDPNVISIVDVKELRRLVSINEFGEISASDAYNITNKMQTSLTYVKLDLPANASNVMTEDQFGREMTKPALLSGTISRYNVTFALPVESGRSTIFKVKYNMLTTHLGRQEGSDSYVLTVPLFEELSYYVEQASATFTLPEGARLQSFEKASGGNAYGMTESVYQATLTVTKQSVISLDHFNVKVTYAYSPIWLAFRPAIWVWAVTLVGCVGVFIWRRPKAAASVAAPTLTVKLQPEYLKSFSDSYEEKLKIMAELDSLEARVEKGRIPRRRYKVQRETLRTRLNTLDRTLGDYKQRLRGAGGHYSELMLQLEVAESELGEVGNAWRNDELRHNQGELSLEAFNKRQDDYQSRKADAESKINGILLRFREETR